MAFNFTDKDSVEAKFFEKIVDLKLIWIHLNYSGTQEAEKSWRYKYLNDWEIPPLAIFSYQIFIELLLCNWHCAGL